MTAGRALIAMVFAALSLGALGMGASAADEPPELDWPVDCVAGEDCFLRFFVDHDSGPGLADFACGTLTYDGHTSTDIQTRDLKAMRAGVDVLAAAYGIVLATRDGEPDISVRERGHAAISGREAGNAVVITHGGGWVTQYSHLREGSITVSRGQVVKAGQPIGQIGLSGRTDFPHVDFSVRHQGRTIDPYTGNEMGTDCRASRTPLWSGSARTRMSYAPIIILHAGFAPKLPTKQELKEGPTSHRALPGDTESIVFFISGFGHRPGDVEVIRLTGPDGDVLMERKHELTTDNPRSLKHVRWRKRATGDWPTGNYRVDYRAFRSMSGKYKSLARVRRTVRVGTSPPVPAARPGDQ